MPSLPRSLLLLFLLASAAVVCPSPPAFAQSGSTPNIILIVADDLAPGDLGCHGQTNIPTPHIDRLAREGARFTRAYAGSPHETAARAALLTGRHAGSGRIRGEPQTPLLPEEVTLAEVVRAVGYRAVALGKWSLGWEGTTGEPRRQGFEEWMGYHESRDALHPFPVRLWRNEEPYTPWANRTGEARIHSQDLFLLAATNVMRFNPDRPFFTYFASTLPLSRDPIATNGPGARDPGRFAQRPWPLAERRKAEAIARLDDAIGSILDGLDRHRIAHKTLLILTSDQPPGTTNAFRAGAPADPKAGDKPTPPLSEAALRVPLILWWPGTIRPGLVVDQPVAHWDILPTVAEAARCPVPEGLDGRSFLPLARGREVPGSPRPMYWEFHGTNGAVRAAALGRWKAVEARKGSEPVFYELPAETRAEQRPSPETHPEVGEILGALEKYRRPWTAPTHRPPAPPWNMPKTAP